ncbi:SRPBCC family protein [Streptomyces silvensis]|uniref:ATPase n=1 Tax=Streptomyces silvensis TaxID=1765722 RepID=A0A0W7X1L9_9ACTN|nr:SRPBCC family protein [Streptomyces silvensis]KUF16757.1 ATPase [Streptomyces silvensis]
MPYNYAVTAHSPARPATVFDVLLRPGTWPSWSPIEVAEVEGDGDPDRRQQIGDTRIFSIGRNAARERITGLVPDRTFSYENPGAPFRTYHGTVALAEAPGGGTDITWSAVFEPRLRLAGPFWRWYLKRFMQGMADGLAAYAGKAADQDTAP